MAKTYILRKEDIKRSCFLVDASGKVLGRLATQVAAILSGKARPDFTPHVDSGDMVVIINAEKIKITGKKMQQKEYKRYSDYPNGLKIEMMESLMKRQPEEIIKHAVKGMLPKKKFQKDMIARLKVYAGDKHPHQAQKPVPV
ncbi:MAG: 50S ribosomal protein L13 [Candidatus Omnitrophica bacterium]|nr:50S ribosomal protein L13 [Candidatus Omnitrophota bacterium]